MHRLHGLPACVGERNIAYTQEIHTDIEPRIIYTNDISPSAAVLSLSPHQLTAGNLKHGTTAVEARLRLIPVGLCGLRCKEFMSGFHDDRPEVIALVSYACEAAALVPATDLCCYL